MKPARLLLLPALALAAIAIPAPDADAHACVSEVRDPACDPAACTPGQYHEHRDVFVRRMPPGVESSACASGVNACPPQDTHMYVLGGDAGLMWTDFQIVGEGWAAQVADTNLADCNGDGVGGDFDGDYDVGVGGAFFGLGPWANEPTCRNGLNVHGANVEVYGDRVGWTVRFTTAADDTSGPFLVRDPATNAVLACVTDGVISPIDLDDCISPDHLGTGVACGAGGDGGFWVHPKSEVQVGTLGVGFSNMGTVGWVRAS